jgi:mono/diheme cytochrome c family protein
MFRFVCIVLAIMMAIAPSASLFAQTNAAAQAVRGAVNNLGGAPPDAQRSADGPAAAPVSYERDVLPILRTSCHGCHGPRRTSGGLEMTTFDNLLSGGESGLPAIVPGNPDESYLVQQITPEGGRAAMPQRGRPLAATQIALIRRWIQEGAVNDAAASNGYGRGDAYERERSMPYGATGGGVDTTYVAPNAIALIVLRPAQILAAPVAELLPKEVATAAGMQYLGFDPATVEEVVLFVGQINLMGPTEFGATVKFNAPFRAASIPPHLRPQVQLAELAGKRYLQSRHPMMPSFFGPNNRTLVAAPDATLRRLVDSRDQPKVGPLLDRAHAAPAGGDLYVAVDLASLRPFIEMGIAQAQTSGKVPPEATKYLEIPKLISAAELTFNMSTPGTTSLVIHANDDAAAGQLETLLNEASSNQNQDAYSNPYGREQSESYNPVSQAWTQYTERMAQPFRPQRSGSSITLFQLDGQNPAQQQLVNIAIGGLAAAATLPAFQAARDAAQRAAGASPPVAEQPPGAAEQSGFEQPAESPDSSGLQPFPPR